LADSSHTAEPPDDAAPTATAGQLPPARARRQGHIDRDVFRDVIGRFVTGVTVVTTSASGQVWAATVSALASVSLEPPMLLICLNRSSATRDAIARSGCFAVSILAEHQQQLARWFATKETSKLDAVVTALGPAELPVIREAAAYLECAICDMFCGGTHTVFLAEVVSGRPGRGQPLVYYGGTLGSFADILDRTLMRPCPGEQKGRAS
jgi:flavin reductase (DIM6/NTAB) family NADH-FMN oxidoreductase RutF